MTDACDFKKRDTSSRDYSKGITLHAGLIVILQFLGSRSRRPTLVKVGIPVTGVCSMFLAPTSYTTLTGVLVHSSGSVVALLRTGNK